MKEAKQRQTGTNGKAGSGGPWGILYTITLLPARKVTPSHYRLRVRGKEKANSGNTMSRSSLGEVCHHSSHTTALL